LHALTTPGPHPARPAGRHDDVVAELVAEPVAKTDGRVSAKRLSPAARAAGYEGSARNSRRLSPSRGCPADRLSPWSTASTPPTPS